MSEETATPIPIEVMTEVLERHRQRFREYPHYRKSGVGNITNYDDPANTLGSGIGIGLAQAVDPETLPESQRIPSCLDGVPVFIQVIGEIIPVGFLPDDTPTPQPTDEDGEEEESEEDRRRDESQEGAVIASPPTAIPTRTPIVTPTATPAPTATATPLPTPTPIPTPSPQEIEESIEACEAKLAAEAHPPQRVPQIQPSMSVRHGDREWPIHLVLTWRNTTRFTVEVGISEAQVMVYGAVHCNMVYYRPQTFLRAGGQAVSLGPHAETSDIRYWRGQRSYRWEEEHKKHRIVLPGPYLVVGSYKESKRYGSDFGPRVKTPPLRFDLPSTHWPIVLELEPTREREQP